jgi:predicted transcriptional regulator of viral defense system
MVANPIKSTETQTRQAGASHEESFLTVDQIAELLQLSRESVRQIFAREPGVLRFTSRGRTPLSARGRVNLRVPSSVYHRVVSRLGQVG